MTVRSGERRRFVAHHLHQRRTYNELPSWALCEGLVKKDSRGCAIADQCGQSSIVSLAGFFESTQGRDFANESPCVRGPFRELRLPRRERLPDYIVERMHVHCLI